MFKASNLSLYRENSSPLHSMKRSCQEPVGELQESLFSSEPSQIITALCALSTLKSADGILSNRIKTKIGQHLLAGNNSEIEIEALGAIVHLSEISEDFKLTMIQSGTISKYLDGCMSNLLTSLDADSGVETTSDASLLSQHLNGYLGRIVSLLFQFLDSNAQFSFYLLRLSLKCMQSKEKCTDLIDSSISAIYYSMLENDHLASVASQPEFRELLVREIRLLSSASTRLLGKGILLMLRLEDMTESEDFAFVFVPECKEDVLVSFLCLWNNYISAESEEQRVGQLTRVFTAQFLESMLMFLEKGTDQKLLMEASSFISCILLFPHQAIPVAQQERIFRLFYGVFQTLSPENESSLQDCLQVMRAVLVNCSLPVEESLVAFLVTRLQNGNYDTFSIGILILLAKKQNLFALQTIEILVALLQKKEVFLVENVAFLTECINGFFDVFGDDSRNDLYLQYGIQAILVRVLGEFESICFASATFEGLELAQEACVNLKEFIVYMKQNK